jgi:hypothetical protein
MWYTKRDFISFHNDSQNTINHYNRKRPEWMKSTNVQQCLNHDILDSEFDVCGLERHILLPSNIDYISKATSQAAFELGTSTATGKPVYFSLLRVL